MDITEDMNTIVGVGVSGAELTGRSVKVGPVVIGSKEKEVGRDG